jgi:RNA polymerase subunit RPABC4/transcription elongation factor Spt4
MKSDQSTGRRACRDCGHLLENTARGCPRCAMNVEAERMIERFVWRRLVPGVIIIGVLAAAAVIYLVRRS